jgi:DNA-binding MarR family transcriptional regulator
VKDWQKAIPKDRLAHIIKDVWRGLVRALTVRLAEHGVSFGHWTFLRILWQEDGLTQRELSERAGVMEPTTFSAIKAMEELGYVTRRQTPENRKNVYVHLTAEGRALKERLVPLAQEVNRVATRGVRPEDVSTTRLTLLAMLENLSAERPTRSSPRPPSRASRTSRSSPGSRRYRPRA